MSAKEPVSPRRERLQRVLTLAIEIITLGFIAFMIYEVATVMFKGAQSSH